MKKESHLVVGANGGIGSALFARLKHLGHNVYGTTQRTLAQEDPHLFHLNLADPPSEWRIPDIQFDVVTLCAGICRMAKCEDDPLGSAKVNIEGMTALAKYFADRGSFVIFLSTNQVFSGDDPHVNADSVYSPLNEYGRQKVVVEEFIKTTCKRSAIVRLTKVVEPNMLMFKSWINQLQNQQSVEAFHDMMLAPVSLRQVLDVLVAVADAKRADCYQVSGEQDVSYLDVAHYLAICLKQPQSLVRAVSAIDKGIKKTFLPRFTTLDCSSTIALCGQKPPNFIDVVKECFEDVILNAVPSS